MNKKDDENILQLINKKPLDNPSSIGYVT